MGRPRPLLVGTGLTVLVPQDGRLVPGQGGGGGHMKCRMHLWCWDQDVEPPSSSPAPLWGD